MTSNPPQHSTGADRPHQGPPAYGHPLLGPHMYTQQQWAPVKRKISRVHFVLYPVAIVLSMILGVAIGAAGTGTTSATGTTSTPADAPGKSQAVQFKEFVNKGGTQSEKAAVAHVTKVQGADSANSAFALAEIHTDYAGDLLGPNRNAGKLLAAAFAEWVQSESGKGVVTVYGKDGDILNNGNF